MPFYYSSDEDSAYRDRGRRRPSAHRNKSDRRRNYLGADLGSDGLFRTRSQGHSPAPVVNVFNDVAADAHQRTEASRSPPWPQPWPQRPPYPPSPEYSQRGRRDRLGSDLINEIEDLTLENRRLRSRSRGRSDAGSMGRSSRSPDYLAWELRQKEKELEEIERKKRWEAEKKRYEQEYEMRKIEDERERKRVIADYERQQLEQEEERKAEEKRILEKAAREKRDKEEKEKREYEEFEKRQKEKKAKEEEDKKKKEADFEEEMRRRLSRLGYTQTQIDSMVREQDEKKKVTQTTTTVEKWKSSAPVYAKIHRDYLSIDTLRYYEIPYEYDRVDPNYIIILRQMDKYETEVLFEHTRRLRAGKLLLEAPGKDKKNYAFYRKRDRSTSKVRRAGILEIER